MLTLKTLIKAIKFWGPNQDTFSLPPCDYAERCTEWLLREVLEVKFTTVMLNTAPAKETAPELFKAFDAWIATLAAGSSRVVYDDWSAKKIIDFFQEQRAKMTTPRVDVSSWAW